jgi:hypothetical protein
MEGVRPARCPWTMFLCYATEVVRPLDTQVPVRFVRDSYVLLI